MVILKKAAGRTTSGRVMQLQLPKDGTPGFQRISIEGGPQIQDRPVPSAEEFVRLFRNAVAAGFQVDDCRELTDDEQEELENAEPKQLDWLKLCQSGGEHAP